MDDREQLNNERIELERKLLASEQEFEQQRGAAQPDPVLMNSLVERIDGCLERLKPVNDRLACLGSLRN